MFSRAGMPPCLTEPYEGFLHRLWLLTQTFAKLLQKE